MSRLRTRGGVLSLGVLGAAVTLLTMSLTWAQLGSSPSPNAGVVLTGREAAPAAFALALAALAGLAVLLLVAETGRRVVGALLVLLGLGIAVSCARAALDLSERVIAGADGSVLVVNEPAQQLITTAPFWAWLSVFGGSLVVGAGILAVLGGPGWPQPSSRYSAAGLAAPTDPWRALDEGVDPTVDD